MTDSSTPGDHRSGEAEPLTLRLHDDVPALVDEASSYGWARGGTPPKDDEPAVLAADPEVAAEQLSDDGPATGETFHVDAVRQDGPNATLTLSLPLDDGRQAVFYAVDGSSVEGLPPVEAAEKLAGRALGALVTLMPSYAAQYGWDMGHEANMVAHARRELQACGQFREDPAFAEAILGAVAAFAAYPGHSGGSHFAGVAMLTRLLNLQALGPLSDDPAEWCDVAEYSPGVPLWQNRRQSSAFTDDPTFASYWDVDDPDFAAMSPAVTGGRRRYNTLHQSRPAGTATPATEGETQP